MTPPLGTRGPALAASTIPPLSVRPCGTRFSNTQEGPNRCRSAPITDPLFRGFGIPNRSTASLVQRAGQDHPFPIFAGSPWRERDLARRVRHSSSTEENTIHCRESPGTWRTSGADSCLCFHTRNHYREVPQSTACGAAVLRYTTFLLHLYL